MKKFSTVYWGGVKGGVISYSFRRQLVMYARAGASLDDLVYKLARRYIRQFLIFSNVIFARRRRRVW